MIVDKMILQLQAYEDGRSSMSVHERKATIKEFYGEPIFGFFSFLLKKKSLAEASIL